MLKIRLGKYDKIWSKQARDSTPYCEYCKAPGWNELGFLTTQLNAHHFKGRACKSTRFMPENAVVLCPSHHVFSSEFSAHRTPDKFEKWFKKKFPARYKKIIKKAQTMMTERMAIKEFEQLSN